MKHLFSLVVHICIYFLQYLLLKLIKDALYSQASDKVIFSLHLDGGMVPSEEWKPK